MRNPMSGVRTEIFTAYTYIHTCIRKHVMVPSIHKTDLLCITEVQIRTIN